MVAYLRNYVYFTCIPSYKNTNMKRTLMFILSLFLVIEVSSQANSKLSPVANALFKDQRSRLSVQDKNTVAASLGFVLSGSKEGTFAQDAASRDFPFDATVYPVDLNNDGIEEICVSWGNSFTSGNTGMSVTLFIKNAAGKYIPHLGFPGTLPDVLSASFKGFPDLLIGGPGMEYPVFRWNGKSYQNHRMVSEAAYSKLKMTGLEMLSRKYQEGIH